MWRQIALGCSRLFLSVKTWRQSRDFNLLTLTLWKSGFYSDQHGSWKPRLINFTTQIISLPQSFASSVLCLPSSNYRRLQNLPCRAAYFVFSVSQPLSALGPDGLLIGPFLVSGCVITGTTCTSSESHVTSLCLLWPCLLNRYYIVG